MFTNDCPDSLSSRFRFNILSFSIKDRVILVYCFWFITQNNSDQRFLTFPYICQSGYPFICTYLYMKGYPD